MMQLSRLYHARKQGLERKRERRKLKLLGELIPNGTHV